jgi:hypothetical protein
MSDRDKVLRAIVWGCSAAGRRGEDLPLYFEAFCIVWEVMK